jgi:hypothetical protein
MEVLIYMANIDFISNTIKPKLIEGTTNYYYVQVHSGVQENGYSKYLRYLSSKLDTVDNNIIDDIIYKLRAWLNNGEQQYNQYLLENDKAKKYEYKSNSISPTLSNKLNEILDNSTNINQLYDELCAVIDEAVAQGELSPGMYATFTTIFNSLIKQNTNSRTIRENAWVIYKKEDDNQPFDEFVDDIKNHRIPRVGDLLFSTENQRMATDSNGNLLLKTYGSGLEKYTDRGDVLVNTITGKITETKGSYYIRQTNEYGYYPVDIMVSSPDNRGNKTVTNVKFNFLTPDGKRITDEDYYRLPAPTSDSLNPTTEKLTPIDRVLFINRALRLHNFYPQGYILQTVNDVTFYPTPMDLIEASDERTKNGLKPLYDDINAMYELINDRFRELDVLCDQLQTRMEKGLIDKETFSNYINNLTDESDRIIEFMSARIPGWSPIKVLEEDVVF